MRTIRETDADTLREVLRAEGPVASVYFGREIRPRREEAELRLQTMSRQLAEQGTDPATLRVLDERVRASLPGTGTLAAFASGGRLLFATELPGTRRDDIAVHRATAHLLPLLEWWQEHPAHVLAVVDRAGADVQVFPQGSTEAYGQTVEGPDDEIVRNAPGGWEQMRHQRRAEDSWEHNAERVAEVLDQDLARVSASLLLLAGDVRALQYVTEHLPPRVRQQVAVHRVRGSRGERAARREHARQVADEVHRAVGEETAALLNRMSEERHPSGRTVEGPHETLAALARGQVDTLVLAHDPQDGRTAWFGPSPTDVADRKDALPGAAGNGLAERAPLADVAVRAAVLTGADVRIVTGDSAAGGDGGGGNGAALLAGGIGALCRYPVNAAA